MGQKEDLHGTFENHHLYAFIRFHCFDYLFQLRYRLRAKDIQRRMVKSYAPAESAGWMWIFSLVCHAQGSAPCR